MAENQPCTRNPDRTLGESSTAGEIRARLHGQLVVIAPGPLGFELGLDDDGLRVVSVSPGSKAQSCGVEPGSYLVTLNGVVIQPTTTLSQFAAARSAQRGPSTIVFSLGRGSGGASGGGGHDGGDSGGGGGGAPDAVTAPSVLLPPDVSAVAAGESGSGAGVEPVPGPCQAKISKATGNAEHSSGCGCKKSKCLKKYCECFAAAVFCGDKCKCLHCENYEGSVALMQQKAKKKDGRKFSHAAGSSSANGASAMMRAPPAPPSASIVSEMEAPEIAAPVPVLNAQSDRLMPTEPDHDNR